MNAHHEVVVIGAGTLGLCTALNLVQRGARATVIEMASVASGSSGRSVGVVGSQLTHEFDIGLRKFGLDQFAAWEQEGLRFNHIGYLRLARNSAQMERFERSAQLQNALGIRSRVYEKEQLVTLVPHLNVDGLAGGIFGPDNGFLDPYEMCTFLADKIRTSGGRVMQSCKLLDVKRHDGGFELVTTKETLRCTHVVNAAGAWATQIAQLLGQTLQVIPERHEAMVIHLSQPLDYTMPMVMDLVDGEGTGLNFRHDKPGELVAEIHRTQDAPPEDPDRYNEICDEASKEHLAELLLERVPDLPGAALGRGWAGLYPMSPDRQPLVGRIDPREPRIVTAAGAGGYGIQLAPAIGAIAAGWVMDDAPETLPDKGRLAPLPDRNLAH